MAIRIGVPKETRPGERRVALVPDVVARLVKQGYEVAVEPGAGAGAHFTDEDYARAGAATVDDRHRLYEQADIVVKVRPPLAEEWQMLREEGILVGFLTPHREPEMVAALRDRRVTAFAMELIPRITRAQSMDALSSQATVAGYKAALLGANMCSRFWPMLTTAAGTIRPARVLVLGAGVAGLQAIATARRLGAVVEAYDVRRAAREQVESLGAKFLAVEVDAQAAGGYARELTDEERRREQALLHDSVAAADVVITTAQIPGRPAPRLIDAGMVGRHEDRGGDHRPGRRRRRQLRIHRGGRGRDPACRTDLRAPEHRQYGAAGRQRDVRPEPASLSDSVDRRRREPRARLAG